jgi:hypothetical protein
MLQFGILELFKNSTLYQFHENLWREPDSARALSAFIFKINKQEYLTAEEATVADDLKTLLYSFSYKKITQLIDIILYKRHQLLPTLDTRVIFSSLSLSIENDYLPSILSAAILNYLCIIPVERLISRRLPNIIKDGAVGTILGVIFNVLYFRYILAIDTIGCTTPLHRAAKNYDYDKFHQLIQRGANPARIDNQWKTAFDLLGANSELNEQYANLINSESVQPYGFFDIAEDFFCATQSKLRNAAISIDNVVQQYVKPLFVATTLNLTSLSEKQRLMHFVKVGDVLNTQNILQKIQQEHITLSLNEQTNLFVNAKSIAVLQTLLVNGLDFRPYLYELYVEKHSIESSGMGAGACQTKIIIMHKLLPHLNEQMLQNINNPDERYCPINHSNQSHPVRTDNNFNDPHRFELAALLKWIAQSKDFINPATNFPFVLNDLVFDLATFEKFMAQIPEHNLEELILKHEPMPRVDRQVALNLGLNIVNSLRTIATKILEAQSSITVYSWLLTKCLPNTVLSAVSKHHITLSLFYLALKLDKMKGSLSNPFYSNAFLSKFNTVVFSSYIWHKTLMLLQTPNDSPASINKIFGNQLNLFYILSAMHALSIIVNFHVPEYYADQNTFKFKFIKPDDFVPKNAPVISYWKDVWLRRGPQVTENNLVANSAPAVMRGHALTLNI